jgi:hypothetical protein
MKMYRSYQKGIFLLAVTFLTVLSLACNKPVEKKAEAAPEANPIDSKIKERGEMLTKELARQKGLKAAIPQMAEIEKFSRETDERQVLSKLGEPDSVRDVKVADIPQKVFYYKQYNYAVWLWRESPESGPFQFRAAVSLKENQKFDLPLHNVLTEEELVLTRSNVEEESKTIN